VVQKEPTMLAYGTYKAAAAAHYLYLDCIFLGHTEWLGSTGILENPPEPMLRSFAVASKVVGGRTGYSCSNTSISNILLQKDDRSSRYSGWTERGCPSCAYMVGM
jgi:hypothetical protein